MTAKDPYFSAPHALDPKGTVPIHNRSVSLQVFVSLPCASPVAHHGCASALSAARPVFWLCACRKPETHKALAGPRQKKSVSCARHIEALATPQFSVTDWKRIHRQPQGEAVPVFFRKTFQWTNWLDSIILCIMLGQMGSFCSLQLKFQDNGLKLRLTCCFFPTCN